MKEEITAHLDEAFKHLQSALKASVQLMLADKSSHKPVGLLWEQFLGKFFQMVRSEGKEHKLNLLSLISFTKVWRG